MPINYGSDSKGTFVRWGYRNKKYYYTTERGKALAYARSMAQARAIAVRRIGDYRKRRIK